MTRERARGSISVEVAILAPAFLLLLVLATMVGRVSVAQAAVTLAAHDAARAASISRDAGAAGRSAEEVARTALREQGVVCETLEVDPDLRGFAIPVGQPAHVEVTVSCLVSFTDIAVLGMTDTRWVRAGFVSPLDTWRARS